MNVSSGQSGEQLFARIIANMPDLNVLSFWSLYGIDPYGYLIDADIDCILLGIDQDGKTHRWFIDIKNYKGGSDTMCINETENRLMRVSRAQHAFVSGPDSKPVISLSSNMCQQRENRRVTECFDARLARCDDEWVVCMVGGDHGTPMVDGAYWAGHIRAVSMDQLIAEIADMHLAYPANIPGYLIDMTKSMPKNSGRTSGDVAPWVDKNHAEEQKLLGKANYDAI